MHLNKLVMRNFKKFRRAELVFQDGLTGIVGGNGAGKSTIVEAVAWALYGSRASSIKRDYIRNIRAGESDSVEVRLSLGLGKQELVIYRAMKGRSLMPEAILLLDGQRIAVGTKDVDLRLEEILKINYQDFMKTFYARQKDLDNLLREGGVGKREYLLKLLGLDDIRESALEQIRSDRVSLEEQKNRLEGSIAEIGDVEAEIARVAAGIREAECQLNEAQGLQSSWEETRKKHSSQLEFQEQKMHSHKLLTERRLRLESQIQELDGSISAQRRRLEEIESARKELAELEPGLCRLAEVRERLDILEPKRQAHADISKKIVAAEAALDGVRSALQDSESRLALLHRDAAERDKLRSDESEHTLVQADLRRLEDLREKHARLQLSLKEQKARQAAVLEISARNDSAIQELESLKARLDEIQPSKERARLLVQEQESLAHQRERQRELDGLESRRRSLEERLAELEGQEAQARMELQELGDLKTLEAALRIQDRELDRLGTDLNSGLADLRARLSLRKRAYQEAEEARARIASLGAEGVCPTCERPLEGQLDHLMQKYEQAGLEAQEEIAKLETGISELMERLDGVAGSRSRMREAFDDLNARKSRSSALKEKLQSLDLQLSVLRSDRGEILASIETLGPSCFDQKRLDAVEAALNSLAPLVEECSSLAARLEDLPRQEAERSRLREKLADGEQRCRGLREEIHALGYDESQLLDSRAKLFKLEPLHNRFLLLCEKALEVPAMEEKIGTQRREQERLNTLLTEQHELLSALGFDTPEHERLQKERRALSLADMQAQGIRLRLAAEPELQRSLTASVESRLRLEGDLERVRMEQDCLAYNPGEHEEAMRALSVAEKEHDKARRAVLEERIRLAVLIENAERQRQAASRKEEHDRNLAGVTRKLEIVDITRGLVNAFMDQVLVRVKREIAATAGEILEEVSGRYSLLKIDDDFNILVEDGGEYYPITRYSGGEIDMIAVSVRVAISEYLMRFGPEGESYSFLILDEVFGSQDQEHREKMIGMLRGLEDRFPQIIAISHISDVQGQFDGALLVIEDEMGNSRVEAL